MKNSNNWKWWEVAAVVGLSLTSIFLLYGLTTQCPNLADNIYQQCSHW